MSAACIVPRVSKKTQQADPAEPTIGERIASIRKAMNLSRTEFAVRVGFSEKTVARWESGATVPDGTAVQDVARRLGVKVAAILGEPSANRAA